MSDLAFGDVVRLEAVVRRHLVDEGGVRESGQRKNLGRYDLHPLPYALPGWPGSPVPLEAGTPVDDRFVLEPDPPEWKLGRGVRRRPDASVRWRRISHADIGYPDGWEPEPWVGLVVGLVVRHEGVIVAGWGGEDPEPPCWHSERRIGLVEVVRVTPDLRCRAHMELALPGDVERISPSPLA